MVSHGNIIYTLRQAIVSFGEVLKLGNVNPQKIVNIENFVDFFFQTSTPPTSDGISTSLAYLPLHHTAGLHAYCFRFFLSPSRLIILPRWDTQAVVEAIPK